MKNIYFIAIIVLATFLFQESFSQSIWLEDFTYPNGTIQGSGTPPKWTINLAPSAERWEVRNNKMEAKGINTEGVWTSESINISSISQVTLTVDLFENGKMEVDDYIGVYYILDGGVETMFETNGYMIDDFKSAVASQSGLTGNSLVIVIRLSNDNDKESHTFDNVQAFKSIPGNYCSDALAIAEVTDLPFSTLTASQSGMNPGCGGNKDPFDIWFAYTATSSGLGIFDLCGSDFDTRLAIWDACDGSVLACNEKNGIACEGDQSSIDMLVTSGVTYYIQVGGDKEKQGDGDLSIMVLPIPPLNDNCVNATPINEVTDLPFSTLAASQSGMNPGCGGNQDPYDLWYAYTATTSGLGIFDLCGSDFDTRLAIWDACDGSVLACNEKNGIACPTDQSSIEFLVTAGVTYYVQVGGDKENKGDGDLSIVVLLMPPLNDDCANASPINEVIGLPFSTLSASQSGENPGCGGNQDPYDLWYAYTATSSGLGIFDLCGSDFDTRLAIWDACGGNVLGCNEKDGIACEGQQSSVELSVISGATYYIQVGGDKENRGNGILSIIVLPAPPDNDNCATATPINEVIDLPFSTIAASQSGENPGCGGNQDPYDLWYAYTATSSGIGIFDLCGSEFDTRLAIWEACGGDVLACNEKDGIACEGQQSSIELNVISGVTYYIQVGGDKENRGDGDLTIMVLPVSPPNDDCANATPINEVTDLSFSTITASQSGENPGCGGNQDPFDIWYAYTATASGIATFDLCGSDFDTRLAIWDACGGNVLACNEKDGIACEGEQSSIEMLVVSGGTYYIQVGGDKENQGNGNLTISVLELGGNDNCANATAISEVTDLAFSTNYATASGANPGCGGDIDPIDVWFAYTASQSGLVSFDLCGSGFDTRIAIWDACSGNVLACNDDDGPICSGLQSSLEYNVTAGITYYVQIGGFNTDVGDGDLTIYFYFPGSIWTGSSSTQWNNPLNWNTGNVPNVTTPVIIPYGAIQYPNFDGNLFVGASYGPNACYNLKIENGGSLTLTGNGQFSIFHNVVEVGLDASVQVNRLRVGWNGTLNINGGTVIANNACQFHAGTGNMSSGSLFVGGIVEYLTPWSATGGTVYCLSGKNTEIKCKSATGFFNDLVVESGGSASLSSESTHELILNGNFIIQPTAEFTLEEPLGAGNVVEIFVGQDLLLNADVSGNASFIDYSTTNVSGITQMQNYYVDNRWHFISAPVSNAVSNIFLGIYLKQWDETTYTWNYIEEINYPLTPGKGFEIYSTLGNPMITYEGGILNKSDQNIPVTATDLGGAVGIDVGEGWNLVGNPYPSAIDLGAPGNVLPDYTWNNLDYTVYFWNGTQYASYNPATGISINSGSRYVPSMQSFFIKANDFNPMLTIPNTARLHHLIANYKSLEENSLLRLLVESDEYSDEIIIQSHPSATQDFDYEFDAHKLFGIEEAPQLYSIINNTKMSIHTTDEITQEDVIDLGFITGESSFYTISATEILNIYDFEVIMLEDKKENTWTNLLLDPTYQFKASGEDEEIRFRLHFMDPIDNLVNSSERINIYSYENEVFIYSSQIEYGNIVVYDIMGRQVKSLSMMDKGLTKFEINHRTGYFLVTVQSGDQYYSEKVYIK